MFPLLFFSAYILDLLTTLFAFLRGATEANPIGWPTVFFNNTVALLGGLAGYFALVRRRACIAAAVAWALMEAAGAARYLVVVNNVLVLVTGFGFTDAVGFYGVLAGTAVLTAVLAPLFFLLAKSRISSCSSTHLSCRRLRKWRRS